MTAKSEARNLIKAAIARTIADGLPLSDLKGVALYNPMRDAPLLALAAFEATRETIANLPEFAERFGTESATRVLLQLIYQYFARVDSVQYVAPTFERLWRDFLAELQNANWIVRGVANIRSFTSDRLLTNLGDGVSIRGRDPADLLALGFDPSVYDHLIEDWHGPGASSFVLVTEQSFAKTPENLIYLDSLSVWTKAIRAIGALRLTSAGSISIGPMLVVRPARFNVGLGGLVWIGASIPASGPKFTWSTQANRAYPALYESLAELEKNGYGKSPGNLAVALRSFMGSYDRWPPHLESQLIDLITGFEALLGVGSEISFRLASRTAGLLAANDKGRSALFQSMRDFYDTRSRLVHGGELKPKHQQSLQQVEELRGLLRRLLKAFIAFAINPPVEYSRTFFHEELDAALVDSIARGKVRTALGLHR